MRIKRIKSFFAGGIVLYLLAVALLFTSGVAVFADETPGKTCVITTCDTADGFVEGTNMDRTSYVEGEGCVMNVNYNVGIFYSMIGLDRSSMPAYEDAWLEAFIYIDKPEAVTEGQFELLGTGISDMYENSLSFQAMELHAGWNHISHKIDNTNLEWAVNVGGTFVYEEVKAFRLYFLSNETLTVRMDYVVFTDTPHTYSQEEIDAMVKSEPLGETQWATSSDVAGVGHAYAEIIPYVDNAGCKGNLSGYALLFVSVPVIVLVGLIVLRKDKKQR